MNCFFGQGVEVNFMDDVGQTLLNWASAFGTQEMVEFLCERGADVNKGLFFSLKLFSPIALCLHMHLHLCCGSLSMFSGSDYSPCLGYITIYACTCHLH